MQLISACLPQSAAESDGQALETMLSDLAERRKLPDELDADTAYGSDDNHQLAAE